jgi:hypothetical protein
MDFNNYIGNKNIKFNVTIIEIIHDEVISFNKKYNKSPQLITIPSKYLFEYINKLNKNVTFNNYLGIKIIFMDNIDNVLLE